MTLPAFPHQMQSLVTTCTTLGHTTPKDDPQSLVLAVELATVLDKLRQHWPEAQIHYAEKGTWPIISWPSTLHQALYGLLTSALRENAEQSIDLKVQIDRRDACLRLDIRGQTTDPQQWLPSALPEVYRLAIWQGGRLFWHVHQEKWQICLKLPFCPAYPK